MFTIDETSNLLNLHEKLHRLNKLLHKANLNKEVFIVDLDAHKTQVEEIKSEILNTLDKINQVCIKYYFNKSR